MEHGIRKCPDIDLKVVLQEEFVVVSTPGTISGISADPEHTGTNFMIPVTGITNQLDVEFDTEEERLYWVESYVS